MGHVTMNNWIAYYNEQQNSLTARSVMVFWLVEGVTVSVQYRSDLFVLWTSENSEGFYVGKERVTKP